MYHLFMVIHWAVILWLLVVGGLSVIGTVG